MLLYGAGDPQYHCEFAERNHCDLRACFRGWSDFFKKSVFRAPAPPQDSAHISCGSPGLGIGLSLGGRPRYRDQSGTRPRAANRARDSSDCRESGSDWDYAPIPLIEPLIGGVLAGRAVAGARDFLIQEKAGRYSADLATIQAPSGEPARTRESAAKKELTKE